METVTPTGTFFETATPTATPTSAPTQVLGWTSIQSDAPLAGLLLYGDKLQATKDMAGLPASVSATTQHYLSHFASSSRWYTGVGVANTGPSAAHVTLTAYSDGGILLGQTDRTVAPNGKISETVTSLFGGFVSGTGWIGATSDLPVQVFDLYGDMVSGGIAGLPSSALGTSFVMPHFVHSSRWWTGITVLNPGASEVSVTLKGYQSDGTLLEEQTSAILPQCKLVGYVEALLPLAANHTGWILVEATGPVTGLLIYGDKLAVPNRIAALPAVPASTQVELSNFFSDSDWWTGIALVNPNGSAANVSMTAYAPDGSPIESKVQVIGPQGKTLGYVSALFELGSHAEGWVEASSDLPVVGMEIINGDDAAEQAFGLAGIESQIPGTAVCMPHHVVSTRWWTLFALANPSGVQTAQMTMNAYDNNGNIVSSTSKMIPTKGRLADYVQEIFGW